MHKINALNILLIYAVLNPHLHDKISIPSPKVKYPVPKTNRQLFTEVRHEKLKMYTKIEWK